MARALRSTVRSALPPSDEKASAVEAMFDRIAPRYDLLNGLLTLRFDQVWRRSMIRRAGVRRGERLVDLGCGTGDVCGLAAAAGARVVGIDFSRKMLAAARARGLAAELVRADAIRLPLRAACADVVTCAFALRNVVSIPLVLAEAARVLSPGGRLALLEVDEPPGRLLHWAHALYFRRVVPMIGALLSDRTAYAYLPQSTAYLPPERELLSLVRSAGFSSVTKHKLQAGIAQLIVAAKS